MEILRIEDLSFKYNGSKEYALKNIDLSIKEGEFVVICGESGCGKTTLLTLLKKEFTPAGEKTGKIYYNGIDYNNLKDRESAAYIGYVQQNPDNQIVTDKVWHELAFGLENIGVPTGVIRRKVGEMASYFGITDWFRKKTDELSGGQKQLLNLAAIMVMQPKILLLDEPTGQLDPIAASEFIFTLQKLNRELGITVIIVEHRLEDAFPASDRVLVMENGSVIMCDSPKNIGKNFTEHSKDHKAFYGLPAAVRIFSQIKGEGECPITVKEGRDFLMRNFKECKERNGSYNACEEKSFRHSKGDIPEYSKSPTPEYNKISVAENSKGVALELKNVWFRYEKDLPDILRGVSVKVCYGEIFCLLGGNGTGKTTMLNVISGLKKAYRGKTLIKNIPIGKYKGNSLYRKNLAFLPQNPQTVFIKDSVGEDLNDILAILNVPKNEQKKRLNYVAEKLKITELLNRHPYDISGGEQQRCALAKLLLLEPEIILLDEPTKGIDAAAKKDLTEILKKLKSDGVAVFLVTHDVEFAAECADRCALFFDGEIMSEDTPGEFFSQNNFYTTAASRMARNIFKKAVTCEQVVGCIERVSAK